MHRRLVFRYLYFAGVSSAILCPQSAALRVHEVSRALLASAFLTEGRVIWPGLGSVGRWWGVWSPALPSRLLELSHTFLRIALQSWHLTSFPIGQHQVRVPTAQGLDWMPLPRWKLMNLGRMSHVHAPLPPPCVLSPRDPLPVFPSTLIRSWPYLSGRRCRSLSTLPRKPLAFTECPAWMHDLTLSTSLSSKLPIR